MKWTVTTLIENHPDDRGQLACEHGLSILIETEGYRLLMDTGDSGAFYDNARDLGISLEGLDGLLLSHAHYDHTGGMLRLIREGAKPGCLYVGKGFFKKSYYVKEDRRMKFIGLRFDRRMLTDLGVHIHELEEDSLEIFPGLVLHRNFMKSHDWEPMNDSFVCQYETASCFGGRCMDSMLFTPDSFSEETVATLDVDDGLILITGCSHSGIMNIVTAIEQRTGRRIRGIIGGTHLMEAGKDRLMKTIDAFRDHDLDIVAVSHCTGEDHLPILQEALKDRFIFNNTGNVIRIE